MGLPVEEDEPAVGAAPAQLLGELLGLGGGHDRVDGPLEEQDPTDQPVGVEER